MKLNIPARHNPFSPGHLNTRYLVTLVTPVLLITFTVCSTIQFLYNLSTCIKPVSKIWPLATCKNKIIKLCEIHVFSQKELVQLFCQVGNVQDCHLQSREEKGGYTYGLVTCIWICLIIHCSWSDFSLMYLLKPKAKGDDTINRLQLFCCNTNTECNNSFIFLQI